MHLVVHYVVFLDRSECSETYMERQLGNLYAAVLKALQEFFGEMKPCSRCCGRTRILVIDRLVALRVIEFLVNIRRKRYSAGFVQNFLPDAVIVESDYAVAVVKDLLAFGLKYIFYENHFAAFSYFLAGARERLPMVVVDSLQEQKLYRTSGVSAAAEKSGRNYSCVVNNEHVAFVKIFRKVREMPVFCLSGVLVEHQKS